MTYTNNIWILLASSMLLVVQAGYAMMESGMTRMKNAGNIILKHTFAFAVVIPFFCFVGFGLAFGGANAFFGRLDFFIQGNYSGVIPEGVSLSAFISFEILLCAIPLAVFSGAVSERIRFSAYCACCIPLVMIVYPVSLHWTVPGGWLYELGFHDYAGAATIQMTGGTMGLIGAKLIGARRGRYTEDGQIHAIPGHNLTIAALGALLLLFSWCSFLAEQPAFTGSSPSNGAGNILLNILTAVSLSVLMTIILTWSRYRKPDISMTINAIPAGLVAVSAGCDTISPLGAAMIGILTGVVLVLSIEKIDQKLKIDDPIGVISISGCCGFLGTVLTGLFSVERGLFYKGSAALLVVNALGSAMILIWTGLLSFLILKIVDRQIGLRVTEREEIEGIGTTEHGLQNDFADYLPLIDPMTGSALQVSNAKQDVPLDEAIPIQDFKRKAETHPGCVLSKIDIICKQSRFEELKTAMNSIGITGMSVSQILGCGIQKGATEYYRGVPVDIQLLPKVRVEIVVAKVPVSDVVRTARSVLYTGHIGDGKIFIYDVRDAVKIRTGETGYDAMQGPDLEE